MSKALEVIKQKQTELFFFFLNEPVIFSFFTSHTEVFVSPILHLT